MKRLIISFVVLVFLGAFAYHIYQREVYVAQLEQESASLKNKIEEVYALQAKQESAHLESINNQIEAVLHLQAKLHSDQWHWKKDMENLEAKLSELGRENEDPKLMAELEQLNRKKEELAILEKAYIARRIELNREYHKKLNNPEQ